MSDVPSAEGPATARWKTRVERLRRNAPWISLVVGIAGVALMNRSPERALFVALAASAGWLMQLAVALLGRVDPSRFEGRKATAVKVARFSSVTGAQVLIQQCLFFSLPFYLRAGALPSQYLFCALLLLIAAATLWDPLASWLLLRMPSAIALQLLATFAAANVVLPILGLSNRTSLWSGALITALFAPLVAWAAGPPGRRTQLTVATFGVALAVSGGLLLPAIRRAIPPVPLTLIEAAMGSELRERWPSDARPTLVVPAQLVCASAIGAPRGLRDAIVHVWKKDGAVVDTIPVAVRGGRDEGFRTWSIKRNLGKEPAGRWECSIETVSGQYIGSARVEVIAQPGPRADEQPGASRAEDRAAPPIE